jgi:putative transposase
VTYYVLFFIHLATRRVHVAGVTPNPGAVWMAQVARNVSMADAGFLKPGQYLLHDRDSNFTDEFDEILKAGGVTPVKLPARSPNLNAHAERWVRSVKSECLDRLILFGEEALRRALANFCEHYHVERPHQGKGNVILFPLPDENAVRDGPIQCRERLGGLLATTIDVLDEFFDHTGGRRSALELSELSLFYPERRTYNTHSAGR